METYGLKSGLNAWMIAFTLCPRPPPSAPFIAPPSMPTGTHLSRLKLASGLRTRIGIGIGGGSICGAGAGAQETGSDEDEDA